MSLKTWSYRVFLRFTLTASFDWLSSDGDLQALTLPFKLNLLNQKINDKVML